MISGTLSPIAILWELFALVFLLESVEFVPVITDAVPYFYTIVIGLCVAAYTIYDFGSGK